MLTELLCALCLIVLICTCVKSAFERPAGFPPGPPRLPIFGGYLFLMLVNPTYLHKAAIRFSKWYRSDVIGIFIGNVPVAVVNNAVGVRSVLNSTDFDGRPQLFVGQMRHPSYEIKGIFFKEGAIWKEQRRFILRYLRDFGFGRRDKELELVIREEIDDMLELIRNGPLYEYEKELVKPEGCRVQLPHLFNLFSGNSVFHVVFNERIPRANMAHFLQLVKLSLQFQRTSDDYGKMLSIIPWIRYIFPNLSGYNKLNESNQYIYKYFEEFVARYIATYEEHNVRNFVDLYIKELRAAELKGDATSSFEREQFIMSLIDFTFPAFTAVGVTLSFLIQYLMLYPEVMKRIQSEIDAVVGSGRLPTLDDRQHMPYTEATIRESLRIETLVPSDVPHKALVDTEIMGYKIPKDTVVVPSLHACHNDATVWGDPLNFRPERFLNANGNLNLKLDISLPFGAGKRLCAGETFARNMLFLMITAVCQNFNFILAPGDTLPDLSKTLSGLIISPPDFWVQLEERQVIC